MVPFILEMYFSKFVQFSPFIHVCLLFYCSGFSKFSSKQLVHGLEYLTTQFYSNTKVQNKIQIIVLMENINS